LPKISIFRHSAELVSHRYSLENANDILPRTEDKRYIVESAASVSTFRIKIMETPFAIATNVEQEPGNNYLETPFAIATNVEQEPGNNYRIDIEIIVPVTLEKFRLDLNDLGDQPHQIGGFPASGEWGNVVVTTRGLPRLKPGDKVPVILQES
jgi:hypothetical protein